MTTAEGRKIRPESPDPHSATNPASSALYGAPATAQSASGATTDTAMTGDQFKIWMDMLLAAVRTINLVPVDNLRDFVNQAETLAPLLEPTAYMRGGGQNLRDQGELLAALSKVQRVSFAIAERSKP